MSEYSYTKGLVTSGVGFLTKQATVYDVFFNDSLGAYKMCSTDIEGNAARIMNALEQTNPFVKGTGEKKLADQNATLLKQLADTREQLAQRCREVHELRDSVAFWEGKCKELAKPRAEVNEQFHAAVVHEFEAKLAEANLARCCALTDRERARESLAQSEKARAEADLYRANSLKYIRILEEKMSDIRQVISR